MLRLSRAFPFHRARQAIEKIFGGFVAVVKDIVDFGGYCEAV
jgi:hypothetical protein